MPSVRAWRLNAAVAALRAAFPRARMIHVSRLNIRAGPLVEFRVHHRGRVPNCTLCVAVPILAMCQNENEVGQLIADVVPRMVPGSMVRLFADGEIRVVSFAKPPKPKREPAPVVLSPAALRLAEEDPQTTFSRWAATFPGGPEGLARVWQIMLDRTHPLPPSAHNSPE